MGSSAAAGGAAAAFEAAGELGEQLLTCDWAATPLGPVETWPHSLVTMVSALLRSRFSMWLAWGPELTFFCNDAYRRATLGVKYPWALGRPSREVWAEIWPVIGPRIEGVLSTGEATWEEALELFLERSGYREETYHTFSYSPLTDDDGSIAGMLCVVSEETARVVGARRMATLRELGSVPAAVRTEDQLLADAARQLGGNDRDVPFALVYLFDDDAPEAGRATLRALTGIEANGPAAPAVLDLRGPNPPWPVRELAGGRSVLVEDLSPLGPLPTGAFEEPPTRAFCLPLRRQGGPLPAGFLVVGLNRYRPFDDGYRAFLELAAGQVAAALLRSRAFESERERAAQLGELDRAKTAFFTNVSHELRSPLTLLLGPAEDALADASSPLPQPQRERVELIARSARRLLKHVNTLLDFSRLESDQLQSRFVPVDLAATTRELAGTLAEAIERAGLGFDVDCPPLPEPVWVDQEHWAKIVLNLLSNALKFTFEGKIGVRLDAVAGAAELSVVDTGIGIDADIQERLFERFYQAPAAASRTYEGTGIGLALVAELAEVHGGSVAVSSRPGEGSTFTVRIPLGHDHLPADQLASDDEAPADGARASRQAGGFLAEALRWLESRDADDVATVGRRGGRPQILVVDDNADMRAYVARLLAGEYEVAVAADADRAIELARQTCPDLVVADVMLPGTSGLDLLAGLRADPVTTGMPVMLLSARAGEDAMVAGLDAGADDYLAKPFSTRELLARVRANLELDRVRRTRARLERSQELLDQTQRLAKVGSWELDLGTGAVTGSSELARQLETSAEELASGGLEALAKRALPADVERIRAAVAGASAGLPVDLEVTASTSDGTMRTFRALGERATTDEGRTVVRGSLQDVTEQREAEQALAAARVLREVAQREHQIAYELQTSLLPAPRFRPEGLEVAAAYRAGVEGTVVGGDWYDLIDLPRGRTGLVIGDVMGRGVRAAAVMGQVRAAARAYARLDLAPGRLLASLDAVVDDIAADQILTCIYAVFDPATGRLQLANAGHLPPIVAPPDAAPFRLPAAASPPLGTGRTRPADDVVELAPGARFALYTDGLVERRDGALDDGIAALAAALAAASGPFASVPSRIVEELVGDGPADDVALLVARVEPGASGAG